MALTNLDELPLAIASADNLPSIPSVAMEILRLSRDENSELEDYAEAISRDPAMSAKLLKLSNSSMFSMTQDVTNMRQATMVLGMKTIQLMSLSFSLTRSAASSKPSGDFDFAEYWRRSLIASVAGRSFGKLLNIPMGDEAFMCGLLSNIGQLVMNQCITEDFAEVLESCEHWPTNADEERILGYSHSALGGVLLKSWELPQLICDTVTHMHDPSELPDDADERTQDLTMIMNLASHVVCILCDEAKGDAMTALIEATNEKGIPEEQISKFLISLEGGINETADLLELKISEGQDHSEVVEAARKQMMHISLGTAACLQQVERRAETLEQKAEDLEHEKRDLQVKATTDKLTGIANRAGFDEAMEREVSRRINEDVPNALGLLIIDIDKFKTFNDTYGHQAGDAVLKVVGAVMRKLTRESDMPARYGGEEFAVIVPQTTPFALGCYAERIRTEIESTPLPVDGHTLNITISVGGVCMSKSLDMSTTIKEMISAADALLYNCKENGRNRSEIQRVIMDATQPE